MVFPNLCNFHRFNREREEKADAISKKSKNISPLNIRKPQKLQKTKEKCDFVPRNFFEFFLALVSSGCYESLEFLLIFVMKPNTTDGVGLLAEADKPTKTPWFLRFAGAILRKIGSARTGVGADKDGLLAKDAKGFDSLVQNILFSRTQKESVRPVQKAFRLREVSQTAGVGTIYGLLFAGLLLMPFQSHRVAAADPPAEDNYEDQALPVLGIGAVFVIGLVAGYLATAAWDGTKWKAKQSKLPKGKVVAIADLVKHSHYLSDVAWSHGDKQDERTIQYPHYADVDYSYYYVHVTEIVWDAEEGEFRRKSMWYWFGTGYTPYSLDHYNNASYTRERSPSNEFTSAGYHIIHGHTENVNLTHAFDSDVDENSRDNNLAADSRSPRYYKPLATAWLSQMRYRGGHGHFTYKKLDKPLRRSKQMSTTRDDYKTVDMVPKLRRLDRSSIRFNRSTLSWKWGEKTVPAGSTKTVTNPDGEQFVYVLPESETLKFPEPHQEIDTTD